MTSRYVIGKMDIGRLIDAIREKYVLYGPVEDHFAPVESFFDMTLGGARVLFGPKKLFFPERQVVFSYKSSGEIIDPLKSGVEKRAIFGARACDVRALKSLDRYFGEVNEPFYMSARENTLIVGMTCTQPHESCFCTQFGGPGNDDLEYDLWLTDLGNEYLLEVGSEKGKEIVEKLDLPEGDRSHLAAKERIIQRVELAMGWNKIPPERIFNSFRDRVGDELWDVIGERCFACGKCNMICPTCHCFDVHDDSDLDGNGQRIRVWDSCHLWRYGLVAGGHNFRDKRLARAQYRIYDKFYYPMERYGDFACVGCGRCFDVCSADIDLRDVLKEITGGE